LTTESPEVADFKLIVKMGLDRGAYLLSAGELVVARQMGALEGDPARLYVRLVNRKPTFFAFSDLEQLPVDNLEGTTQTLLRLGLLDQLVPWNRRAAGLPVRLLKEHCRKLKLPTAGRRNDLVARLGSHCHWSTEKWLRLRHRALYRRLERWAFLSRHRDRSAMVVERLGHVRWPQYELTSDIPPGELHGNRRTLLAWEDLYFHGEERDADAVLEALKAGLHRAPSRLDLGHRSRKQILEIARTHERQGQHTEARRLYTQLVELGQLAPADLALRVARTWEKEGHCQRGLAHLNVHRTKATAVQSLAISRMGRRMAKLCRRGWAPDVPLLEPRERKLRLVAQEKQANRPTFGPSSLPAERAVVEVLADHGRRAVMAEGTLWTTLFALLFAEVYFIPVPHTLPVPFLTGPLDLGTPQFVERRKDHIADIMAAIDRGDGPRRIIEEDGRHRGERLAGANWQIADGPTLATIAEGVGPRGLSRIINALLHGRRSAAGLPDLVVLPGKATRIECLWPTKIPSSLFLVEVKGPTDAVRDEQTIWFDRLLHHQILVELWQIVPFFHASKA
jgi:hypothetical protein